VANTDILIIGGGVAGLSAGAALAQHAKVTVLEGEEQIGFHSSGRSATMLHYALGNPLVRALTLASRSLFDDPPEDFSDVPLGRPMPVLIHAREHELADLEALEAAIAPYATLERAGVAEMLALCRVLRTGRDGAVAGLIDRDGIRLDPHALLQAYLKAVRARGGDLVTNARVAGIEHRAGTWHVRTVRGESFVAPIIVNAAGAWADEVARLAGIAPLGFEPLRRTIITFDAPAGVDASGWPFTKTIGDELYFAPESGRLFASPMDEVPTDPCDAQPEEYEIALAAWRMEERTTMKVGRIHSRWAGLRTFAPDRHPVAGFAPQAEGFFWLAGQGGFGLQTSPVMARIAAALITDAPWPIAEVGREALAPDRFA
jgi:D-arginine dehydrogenase